MHLIQSRVQCALQHLYFRCSDGQFWRQVVFHCRNVKDFQTCLSHILWWLGRWLFWWGCRGHHLGACVHELWLPTCWLWEVSPLHYFCTLALELLTIILNLSRSCTIWLSVTGVLGGSSWEQIVLPHPSCFWLLWWSKWGMSSSCLMLGRGGALSWLFLDENNNLPGEQSCNVCKVS